MERCDGGGVFSHNEHVVVQPKIPSSFWKSFLRFSFYIFSLILPFFKKNDTPALFLPWPLRTPL